MEKQTKQLTEEEKIKRISELALRLTHGRSTHTLEELFDLTGNKEFIIQAIELENPSKNFYPKYGAMGGCDFGYRSSERAAELAEKIGDNYRAVNFYKEAIKRLTVFKEWSQRDPDKWKSWDRDDERDITRYYSKIGELEKE